MLTYLKKALTIVTKSGDCPVVAKRCLPSKLSDTRVEISSNPSCSVVPELDTTFQDCCKAGRSCVCATTDLADALWYAKCRNKLSHVCSATGHSSSSRDEVDLSTLARFTCTPAYASAPALLSARPAVHVSRARTAYIRYVTAAASSLSAIG